MRVESRVGGTKNFEYEQIFMMNFLQNFALVSLWRTTTNIISANINKRSRIQGSPLMHGGVPWYMQSTFAERYLSTRPSLSSSHHGAHPHEAPQFRWTKLDRRLL
mmetsp:Transcript_31962/g.95721  ORF Transcript_31962/g.95721 Transcript_31962/m.95721 type:complete len:105 (+) Transcript_31962:2428-2742(+)